MSSSFGKYKARTTFSLNIPDVECGQNQWEEEIEKTQECEWRPQQHRGGVEPQMTSVDILGLGGVRNSQISATFNNFTQSYIEVDSVRIILIFYFPFNGMVISVVLDTCWRPPR